MIKNVNVNQLLFSDLLVKEPVSEVNSGLDEKRGNLILTGSSSKPFLDKIFKRSLIEPSNLLIFSFT